MTPIELLRECQRVTEQGLSRMMLTIPARRRRRSENVRVMPSVPGRVIGSTVEGRLLVDVKVADVVAVLERVMLPTVVTK